MLHRPSSTPIIERNSLLFRSRAQSGFCWKHHLLVLVSLGVTGLLLTSCGGSSTKQPAPLASVVPAAVASPTPAATPIEVPGGIRVTNPIVEERWGSFVLTPDVEKTSSEIRNANATTPARRTDFPWMEGENVWDHRLALRPTSASAAALDPRVPVPSFVPGQEEFLAAYVLGDERGPVNGGIAYGRTSHPDWKAYGGGLQGGNDHTIWVAWSVLYSQPAVFLAHAEPIPANAATVEQASIVQETTQKVTVRGYPGIIRVWSGRGGQSLFGARVPSVALNWYEGDVWWTVQASFLSPAEVLQVAESIRTTATQ